MHDLVRANLLDNGFSLQGSDIIKQKVKIIVSAYYKFKPVDPDNICSKMYIDGLKGILLSDDTLYQVESVTTQTKLGSDNHLEIDIMPANEIPQNTLVAS